MHFSWKLFMEIKQTNFPIHNKINSRGSTKLPRRFGSTKNPDQAEPRTNRPVFIHYARWNFMEERLPGNQL